MKVNVHYKQKFVVLIALFIQFSFGQNKREINKLDELIQLAKQQNNTLKNNTLQLELAAITKKTAIGNIFNPRIPSSAQIINNFDQQVSFLPGPIFGQPEGTYKPVTMGQQYVGTVSVQPQIDLINLGSIALVKSAKINEQIIENQNKINEQNIYDQLNSIYFNLLLIKNQKEVLEKNIKIARQILVVNQNKYKEGITRKQDVNEAESNLITIEEKLSQLEYNEKIQLEALDVFYEDTEDFVFLEDLKNYSENTTFLEANSELKIKASQLQFQNIEQEIKVTKWSQLPILSMISSFNWQNQSNNSYLDKNSNWINYNYIGLKLSWDLPTTIQKLSNIYSKKIQLNQLKNNIDQVKKENEMINKQIVFEYEKAIQQYIYFEKIYQLKKETFEKNKNQFDEEILPLDKLLISQNDYYNSEINLVIALANIGFSKYRIIINNY